jgi:hypothetical protein
VVAAIALGCAAVLATTSAIAQTTLALREVPTRSIPVPTDVSPQMQKIIALPPWTNWDVLPKSGDEWKAGAAAGAATIQNATQPARAHAREGRARPDRRREGVCRDTGRDSTGESQPPVGSRAWRLLPAQPRRGGHARSDPDGLLRPPGRRHDRVEGRRENGRPEEYGDL